MRDDLCIVSAAKNFIPYLEVCPLDKYQKNGWVWGKHVTCSSHKCDTCLIHFDIMAFSSVALMLFKYDKWQQQFFRFGFNSRNLLHLVILIPLIYSINIEWHFWRENSSVNFWNSIIKQQLMRSGIEERKTKSAIFQFSSSLGKAPHENQPKSSRLRFITEETDKIEMFPTCRMERTFS